MKTIFLVEDNPIISHLYRTKFSAEGFDVPLAEDGLEAVKWLATAKPDLVVLDLMLPILSGVDVLKYIRSKEEMKMLPVILLSEAYMSDLAQQAAAVGVQQTLLKSACTPNLLLGIVNDILAGRPCHIDPSLQLAVPTEPIYKT